MTPAREDPTTIQTGGGGPAALVGLPFFAIGLAVLVGGAVASRSAGVGLEQALPMLGFGLVFASVGAGILFGRSGVDLARDARRVVAWWSLLGVRVWTREQAVPDGALVTLTRETRKGSKGSTYTVFVVRLEPADGGAVVSLGEPREHALARRLAERAGKAFRADVEDRTLDPPSRRRADQLDASLRDRHRDAPPPAPRAPAAPACATRVERRKVIVEVPPAFPAAVTIAAVGSGCLVLFMLFPLGLAALAGREALPFLGVMLAAVLIVGVSLSRGPLRAARRFSSRARIELDRDAVVVAWGDERLTIPTDELEEVAFAARGHGPMVVAGFGARLLLLSDALTIEVPLALAQDECEWLADLVVFVASTGEPPPPPERSSG